MYVYELGFRGVELSSSQWGKLKEFSFNEGQQFYIEKRFKSDVLPSYIKLYGVDKGEIEEISHASIAGYSYDKNSSELTINLTSRRLQKLYGTMDSKISVPIKFSNDALTEGQEKIKIQMFLGDNEVSHNYLENNPSTLTAAILSVGDTSRSRSVGDITLTASNASNLVSDLLSLNFKASF